MTGPRGGNHDDRVRVLWTTSQPLFLPNSCPIPYWVRVLGREEGRGSCPSSTRLGSVDLFGAGSPRNDGNRSGSDRETRATSGSRNPVPIGPHESPQTNLNPTEGKGPRNV